MDCRIACATVLSWLFHLPSELTIETEFLSNCRTMDCRTNELSKQWTVGLMNCRTSGLSDQWTVGPMDCTRFNASPDGGPALNQPRNSFSIVCRDVARISISICHNIKYFPLSHVEVTPAVTIPPYIYTPLFTMDKSLNMLTGAISRNY